MRLLTVPNWSFGRNRDLMRHCREILEVASVVTHYCQGDVDHNRTVIAISGEAEELRTTLNMLCALILPAIDLNRHVGVHPRIGALDVCPFVLYDPNDLAEAIAFVDEFAQEVAETWRLPVYLYERSEKGRHESDLPSLRRGGFGSLALRDLRPDFGPLRAHPQMGVAVMGVRDFLIAMNVNLDTEDLPQARKLAREIRELRQEGDPRFLGVRALGLPLASREVVQVSLNLTLPDLTEVDPIVAWIRARAQALSTRIAAVELVGVVRKRDLETGTALKPQCAQVVW